MNSFQCKTLLVTHEVVRCYKKNCYSQLLYHPTILYLAHVYEYTLSRNKQIDEKCYNDGDVVVYDLDLCIKTAVDVVCEQTRYTQSRDECI